MNILHYSENVYHQFFRKIDEVDYFLHEAVDNQERYTEASLPKDNKFFDKMQFVYSAFLSALVSTWEISRLSIQLENSTSGRKKDYGLPSERSLTSDLSVFNEFFDVVDGETHALFSFLKVARNASAHDGSCAVNGGNVQVFKFQSDLHRFDWDQSARVFKHSCTAAAQLSAVTSMLAMAYKLSPLFLIKLKRPKISPEISEEIATFNIDSLFDMRLFPSDLREQAIISLVQCKNLIPNRRIDQNVIKWEKLYGAAFISR